MMAAHGPITNAFNRVTRSTKGSPDKVGDAKEVYKDANGKMALLGIYDTKTKTIYLHPVIPNYVWIEIDRNTGKYTQGWTVDRNLQKMAPLSRDELDSHHKSGYIPRVFSYKGEDGDYRAHHFLLNAVGEAENIGFFRGFSISENGELVWMSRALNGPHGHDLVQEPHKTEIEEQIQQWNTPTLKAAI